MYENVCRYVDRLFRAVRPRKMLYLAIDGVAPRAKMNQQRARRFKGAQEVRENAETEREVKKTLMEAGHHFTEEEINKTEWDSNVITPGTPFMLKLSEFVRFYVRKRISTDASWKKIAVIFSDASIPGEGEHKIITHIRHQRSQSTYNPNLVHVLHGLDADLIMLALATHELHFYILREEVLFGWRGAEDAEKRKQNSGHADAQRQLDDAAGAAAMQLPENKIKSLQRLSIPILREYLANEFKECLYVPFKEPSFERLIDDIVFLCFFVGNDFLPHLPSMDIRDGALDFLFNVYKRILPSLGDYITSDSGDVNLSHVDVILAEVGAIEDYIFNMKHSNEQHDKEKRRQMDERRKRNLTRDGQAPKADLVMGIAKDAVPIVGGAGRATKLLASIQNDNTAVPLGKKQTEERKAREAKSKSLEENAIAAKKLKVELAGGDIKGEDTGSSSKDDAVIDESTSTTSNGDGKKKSGKRKVDKISTKIGHAVTNSMVKSDAETSKRLLKSKIKESGQQKLNMFAANVEDKVRLHEAGWKDRYYTDKCKADDVAEHGGKEHLFRSYVVGLCWVMKYYYDGCPSWKWYYPFHYAPFASDLRNIERFVKDCTSFELEQPFKPVEQLMAVLPEDSSHAIPKASCWLMRDSESPIIDFYPKDVLCDPNGKAMPWLWVVLLPFIDEDRLFAAMAPSIKKWTQQELLCNARGLDDGYVYCHVTHPLASAVSAALDTKEKDKLRMEDIADVEQCSITGFVRRPLSNEVYPLDDVSTIDAPQCPMALESYDDLFATPIEPNAALCIAFTEPTKVPHKSALLSAAKPLDPVLSGGDLRIRRPKLNRGGGTISNLGGNSRDNQRNQSHQPGHGSMNISNYERGLAERNGRGHQMQQTGTRAWGAMEPSRKRPNDHGRGRGGTNHRHHNQHNPTLFQQPVHNGGPNARNHGSGSHRGGRHHDFRDHRNPQNHQDRRWQAPPQQMPQQHRPAHHAPRHNQYAQPPPQLHQPHLFRGTHPSHPGIPAVRQGIPTIRSASQTQKQGSGVNPSLMKSLKSQLASTLKKNQQGGGTGN